MQHTVGLLYSVYMIDKQTLKVLVKMYDARGEFIEYSEDPESEDFGVYCEDMSDFVLVVYANGKCKDTFHKEVRDDEIEEYLRNFVEECKTDI